MTRGRPRQFDTVRALDRAIEVFRAQGFAATSVDELALAMGISKPSLYGAYGDKEALYLAALQTFAARIGAAATDALAKGSDLEDAIRGFCSRILDLYVEAGELARGCLVLSVSATDATTQPEVRALLGRVLASADEGLAHRIHHERGVTTRRPSRQDLSLARVVTGVLASLGIRARAGARRDELDAIVNATARLVANSVEINHA